MNDTNDDRWLTNTLIMVCNDGIQSMVKDGSTRTTLSVDDAKQTILKAIERADLQARADELSEVMADVDYSPFGKTYEKSVKSRCQALYEKLNHGQEQAA